MPVEYIIAGQILLVKEKHYIRFGDFDHLTSLQLCLAPVYGDPQNLAVKATEAHAQKTFQHPNQSKLYDFYQLSSLAHLTCNNDDCYLPSLDRQSCCEMRIDKFVVRYEKNEMSVAVRLYASKLLGVVSIALDLDALTNLLQQLVGQFQHKPSSPAPKFEIQAGALIAAGLVISATFLLQPGLYFP